MINLIESFGDIERFLYNPIGYDEFADVACKTWIHMAEEALGFKLFSWQKMMIAGMTREYGRVTGKSLTWALMKLHGSEPIDMTKETMSRMNAKARCNYELLMQVAEKLDERKVKHAPICSTRKQLLEAERNIRIVGRMNGKHNDIVFVDDLPLSDQV